MHGQPVTFCEAGADSGGPVLVLLHGLASSSQTWAPVLPLLGRVAHVIAPDLLGHGQSAKPRPRGLLAGRLRRRSARPARRPRPGPGHDRRTLLRRWRQAVQFGYQFPQLTQRLVPVASGGLGPA